MRRWIFLFLASVSSAFLFGEETLTFKERMAKAKNGDYFVIEANKMVTLIAIRSWTPRTLLIEEISIPAQSLPKEPPPLFWTDWVKKRAPGHTSWAMIEIDLLKRRVIECYSFSRGSWMQPSFQENLFTTLLDLPLEPIPNDNRRHIGPPPLAGENDVRQVWEPPLFFEGKKKEGARCDAFEASWPEDGSELSGKNVTLYFDRDLNFPLPFWIQVDSSHATATIRTIDAGRNFVSPHRTFPRRVPEFLGAGKRNKEGLLLNLKSPQYYREFELYAIDVTSNKRTICPINFCHLEQKEESLTIQVDDEELHRALQKEHRYTWLLVPVGYSESYTESPIIFTWR